MSLQNFMFFQNADLDDHINFGSTAWNHLPNINKNNSKNNHNNFCLTSCARIYPKPSTIDMKWTLIKDLGKTCCNLQSKNKRVIKMSSFRGVASVLQGGEGRPQNVSKRGYSPDWHNNLHAVFCLKEGLKKKRGVHKHPRTPPSYVPVLWQQASLPTENFLLWLHPTHKIYQKVSDPWEQPTTP